MTSWPASPRFDRSAPPEPRAIRAFKFPPFTHTQLANGMHVLAARVPAFPLVFVEALLPAGGQFDGLHAGLATLHAALLDEGTARSSALDLAQRIERLGGSLTSGANWDIAFVTASLLAEHGADGLELVAEICRTPNFPEEEIERLRQQRLAEILRRKDQPNVLGDLVFSDVVYRDTAYGRPLLGSAESITPLTRDHLLEFYQRHSTATGAALIAVGDLDPEALLDHAVAAFGDWPCGLAPQPPEIAPQPLAATEIHVVDRPGAAQTRLQLGHASLPRNHPDYTKFLVLNGVFGGKFTSRINLNLREQHGFTYGAASRLVRRQGPGPFTVTTAVKTETTGAAVAELLLEMRKLREELVPAAELKETSDYLIGVFPYILQTISDVAQRLEDLVVFGFPDDFYETYPGILAEVTADDVLRVAREHLHPDHLAIVAVGPAELLVPQLEALGPVRVVKL